jgi:hypothetical protein
MPPKPKSYRGRKPASTSKQTRRKGPAEPTETEELNEDNDAVPEASGETNPSGDAETVPQTHAPVKLSIQPHRIQVILTSAQGQD